VCDCARDARAVYARLRAGIPGVSFVVERFEILATNPIDSHETSTILAPFIGPHDGLERLLEASTELE
jgi:hypothetical protein